MTQDGGPRACGRETDEGDGAEEQALPCSDDGATGAALEAAVLDLLAQRAPGATICPSEAARAVGGQQWRPLMEPARQAARRLVARGEVEVTQGGRVVDVATAKGPVRVRRREQPRA